MSQKFRRIARHTMRLYYKFKQLNEKTNGLISLQTNMININRRQRLNFRSLSWDRLIHNYVAGLNMFAGPKLFFKPYLRPYNIYCLAFDDIWRTRGF